jgi:hypothetical protein
MFSTHSGLAEYNSVWLSLGPVRVYYLLRSQGLIRQLVGKRRLPALASGHIPIISFLRTWLRCRNKSNLCSASNPESAGLRVVHQWPKTNRLGRSIKIARELCRPSGLSPYSLRLCKHGRSQPRPEADWLRVLTCGKVITRCWLTAKNRLSDLNMLAY